MLLADNLCVKSHENRLSVHQQAWMVGVCLVLGLSQSMCGGGVIAASEPPPAMTPMALSGLSGLAGLPGPGPLCRATPESADIALAPWPKVPPQARRVTDFGAVPNDNRPDDAAIAAALAALKPGDWLVFPPGRYLQAGNIEVHTPGVTLWGVGARLHATDARNHALSLRASGVRLYGFTLSAVTDVRRSAAEQSRVNVYQDESAPGLLSGNVLRGLTITDWPAEGAINSAGSAGILIFGARNFLVAENTVRRTLADGIHVTGGSRQGWVLSNTVQDTGDDMIAVVSYRGDVVRPGERANSGPATAQVSDVLVAGNSVTGSYWGRGIAVVGSQHVTVCANRIARVTRAAGLLLAQEGAEAADTPGLSDVRVLHNQIDQIQTLPPDWLPGGPSFADLRQRVLSGPRTGHGGIEMHAVGNTPALIADAGQAALRRVERVLIRCNLLRDVAADGIRIGADTPATLLRGVRLQGNLIERQAGQALALLLPQAVTRLDETAGCATPTRSDIEGARLGSVIPG